MNDEILTALREIANRAGAPTMDYVPEYVASLLTLQKSIDRKMVRTRKRLEALCSGGWVIEFEPRQHLGLQTSDRGARRRGQLGRV